jgi:transporter family protein
MASWVAYAFLSAFAASLVAIFGKLGLRGVDPVASTFVRATIMTLVCAISVAALSKSGQVRSILTGSGMGWIVASAVAGALSWLWYFMALKSGSVTSVVAIDRLSVVFAFALAVLVLGERFTWLHGVGAALVAVGAFIMTRP